MTHPRLLSTLVAAGVVLGSVRADADIADLYLRKIRKGEKTFFQAGGWQHWRNRFEVFWEPNYYDLQGGWGAGEDVGAIVLLSKPRSEFQLTAFTLHSSLYKANGDNGLLYAYLPFIMPLIPQAAETGNPQAEGMTGFQLRLGGWLETAYGVVTDFQPVNNGMGNAGIMTAAGSASPVDSFVEANLPIAYLRTSAVVNNATGQTERSQVTFRYDEATWATFAEAGHVKLGNLGLIMATVDRLGGWFSADARMTDDMSFGYLQAGLHLATGAPGTHKTVGKFGTAFDFKLYGNLINPSAFIPTVAGMPSPPGTSPGFNAEFYVQMPATDWLAVFMLLMGAQTAALQQHNGDYAGAQQTEENTVKVTGDLMKAASEDDRVYGGLTLGVSYNDPMLLRTYGSYNDWYFYLHYRLFY
jgi:hypothetical protein